MKMPVGRVFATRELVPIKELTRTDMYSDWLAPQNIGEGIAVNLAFDGPIGTQVALWRPFGVETFGSEERKALSFLAPHLFRSLTIAQRLDQMDFVSTGAIAALNQITHGIALLDGAGRIRFLNPLAEAIVAEGDALRVHRGTLVAVGSNRGADLHAAICRAVSAHIGASLHLARPSGKPALALLISPLRSEVASSSFGLPPPGVLMVITDPERGGVPPKRRIMQAYQLTSAEASFVMELVQGHDVASIAEDLGITYETARTHLRRVFIKTGAHRQGDLVRMLLREVGAIF
jgi:DNA-binding CsgD family transcriptional regulator